LASPRPGRKTFTSITFIYRLLKHARIKRVLFLVDKIFELMNTKPDLFIPCSLWLIKAYGNQ